MVSGAAVFFITQLLFLAGASIGAVTAIALAAIAVGLLAAFLSLMFDHSPANLEHELGSFLGGFPVGGGIHYDGASPFPKLWNPEGPDKGPPIGFWNYLRGVEAMCTRDYWPAMETGPDGAGWGPTYGSISSGGRGATHVVRTWGR